MVVDIVVQGFGLSLQTLHNNSTSDNATSLSGLSHSLTHLLG